MLKGRAPLTHAIPDAPTILQPAGGANSVDPNNTFVVWNPVQNQPGSTVVNYEVTLRGPKGALCYFAKVGRNANFVWVPPGVMSSGKNYTIEVLARDKGGNGTRSLARIKTG